jgi:peptidoglycan L-alanyl-D-glutamate endopeptidase CwlK
MELDKKSAGLLKKVHPDLARVVTRCAKDWKDKDTSFVITCGGRTVEQQKIMVAKKLSSTMHSRHIIAPNGYAHAVDLAYILHKKAMFDWPSARVIAKAMQAAAKAEKVSIEWGGDWKSFPDGPHFQLPWATHPGTK